MIYECYITQLSIIIVHIIIIGKPQNSLKWNFKNHGKIELIFLCSLEMNVKSTESTRRLGPLSIKRGDQCP